ncbi:MAG TPA: NADH-quinone oxidoreductase subunit N [Acidimicrobiales bacterium]|nr:NADH-quinone oxidoreductase subunit N [Acidimicrobiales bacterium]
MTGLPATLAALAAQVVPGSGTTGSATGCTITPARFTGLCTGTNTLHVPVEYRTILPLLVLAIGALALLVVSAVLPKRSRPGVYPLLTLLISAGAAGTAVWEWVDIGDHSPLLAIGHQILYDRFSVLFYLLISVATAFGALLADSYLQREGLDGVEPYVLMLLASTGAMLMVAAAGTIMLFLGLEIMSIALYVMTAYHRRRAASGEGGLKYFLLGSFSSAIFLYGAALAYGATGTTQFDEMASFLARNTILDSGVLLAGMALLIVGLGFKVAAVPFHTWSPDVYQGAPTPFTGYMAAVAKAAGFAGLLRVLLEGFGSEAANWRPAIWLMAVLTLAVGSVLAIVQRDVKRMLAYSSISQAGYVLIGLQADSARGTAGALFYLFTYTFIIAGSFAVVEVVQGQGEARNDIGALRGLARRKPWLGFCMLVFLLAQAGVPFTSGFLAKFSVIVAVVDRGQWYLAVIGMLAAAIAAFFYLRLGLLLYSTPTVDEATEPTDGTLTAGLEPIAGFDGPVPALSGGPGAAAATVPVALEAPADGRIEVPFTVGVTVVVCAVFTIVAGVSSPVLDFAKAATTLF